MFLGWNLAPAADPEEEPSKAQTLLVLRNGQVFRGEIVREDSHYVIKRDKGSVRIKATDVEFSCESLDEAFRIKREAVDPTDASGLVRLAEWCLKQELVDRATACLDDAREIDERHPKLAQLARRIELASTSHEVKSKPNAAPPSGVSNADLDRLVRGLPEGALETFTRSVQPVLLNNCTAAGCHGPSTETKFKLLRLAHRGAASRRVTHRNLHAAMSYINREHPDKSPLLTVPQRPHGGSAGPAYSRKSPKQFQSVELWVKSLQFDDTPIDVKPPSVVRAPEPADEDPEPDAINRRRPKAAAKRKAADGRQVSFDEEIRDEDDGDPLSDEQEEPYEDVEGDAESNDESASESSNARSRGPRDHNPFLDGPLEGEGDNGTAPRDPFDPEIFNRRYHKQ